MNILWLGQPECDDATLVGGKAANLSRLAARHRVPPGFCLTVAAYARWFLGIETTPQAVFTDELATSLKRLEAHSSSTPLSVAVRSSAVGEDGAEASFAGQHESYLNLAGIEAVAEAVRLCWASTHSERAAAYRRQYGLTAETTQVAVLVQQLVPADASAVVFSANPVTGDRNEAVINASWGLGESIVGGTVTPDTFVVHKASLEVIDFRLGSKERMTISVPEGTREVAVPRLLRRQTTLNDEQVAAAARLATTLEEQMGWPVDLECSWHQGELHLLQCRPITTIG